LNDGVVEGNVVTESVVAIEVYDFTGNNDAEQTSGSFYETRYVVQITHGVSFQEFDSGMPSMGSHYAELRIPESSEGFFDVGFGSEAAARVRVLRHV
jgi:hypothetical protein